MSEELVTWLRERLDEDEQVALAAAPGPWEWGTPDPRYWNQGAASEDLLRGDGGRHVLMTSKAGAVKVGDADHIAAWNPARVLAEVAAKRRVLDQQFAYAATIDSEWGDCCDPEVIARGECGYFATPGDFPLLVALAQPYAGRPGWREEWRIGDEGVEVR